MSDSDVLLMLVPTNPNYPETAADLVGIIRNSLSLRIGESTTCQIDGIKNGIIIRGQVVNGAGWVSFRWSINSDGKTYLKAWGMEPTKIWRWLEQKPKKK